MSRVDAVIASAGRMECVAFLRFWQGQVICNTWCSCVIACPGRKTASGSMRYRLSRRMQYVGFMRYRLPRSQNRVRIRTLPRGATSPRRGATFPRVVRPCSKKLRAVFTFRGGEPIVPGTNPSLERVEGLAANGGTRIPKKREGQGRVTPLYLRDLRVTIVAKPGSQVATTPVVRIGGRPLVFLLTICRRHRGLTLLASRSTGEKQRPDPTSRPSVRSLGARPLVFLPTICGRHRASMLQNGAFMLRNEGSMVGNQDDKALLRRRGRALRPRHRQLESR